jgi:hypothetical protein
VSKFQSNMGYSLTQNVQEGEQSHLNASSGDIGWKEPANAYGQVSIENEEELKSKSKSQKYLYDA